MSVTILRTDSSHPHFIELVQLLDAELAVRDGSEHAFYHQFNGIVNLKHTVVAYREGAPVACGAFKEIEPGTVEIKRMFTLDAARGLGMASAVLKELEVWAASLGYTNSVLETGVKQPEAIALYNKSGYQRIPNYGQYAGIENSVCFSKPL